MATGSSSFVTAKSGARGADVAQTWRGARPPYPLRRTCATERTRAGGLRVGAPLLGHVRNTKQED